MNIVRRDGLNRKVCGRLASIFLETVAEPSGSPARKALGCLSAKRETRRGCRGAERALCGVK